MKEYEDEEDRPMPCGCVEYHTADCPRLHPDPIPEPDDGEDWWP